MSSWRISPEEERWLALASRFRKEKHAPIFDERSGGWRSVRLVTRCAFFGLGTFVAFTALSICHLLHLGKGPFVAGLLLVAAAEWLIVSRRLVFSGIEEALELTGLQMIVFGLLDIIHSSSFVKIALLAALTFAIVGWRLLNPLFTTLGAIALSVAFMLMAEKPSVGIHYSLIWAGALCYVLAWLALFTSAARFERPSHDRMLGWLTVFMPLVGYLWLVSNHGFTTVDYFHNHSFPVLLSVLLPLSFGITALIVGMRNRTHAPLIACMICIACVAYELRELTGMPLEARLIVWGCFTLLIATILDRILRRPRAGITSEKLRDNEGALNLLELAGAAVIAPRAQPIPATGVAPSEGRFGGGGASGSY